MNKRVFANVFRVGDVVDSGAKSTRKNAGRIRILAIETALVRYESVSSKKPQDYSLRYTHLKVLLRHFEDVEPKSIEKSVNKVFSTAGLSLDHKTETYQYGIARAFRERTKIFLSQGESDSAATKGFFEGERVKVWVERSERDRKARELCIQKFGAWCQVCGFDFEKVFGLIGRGFIHVHHHRKQISKRRVKYKVDPIKDLIPVCPNCHAMAHSKPHMLSIVDLRRILAKSGSDQPS